MSLVGQQQCGQERDPVETKAAARRPRLRIVTAVSA
jgi:hypothetical protein